jgi:pimeloyl-ACP methyl ester carboxylesterase
MLPDGGRAEAGMTLLASDRAGHGEPLLLLHGIGSTRDDFSALLPRLAEHFDVLSVDLPGHGESPVGTWPPTVAALTDAVEADLDARGLERVHVLGNSLGARIGIELAVRHRTRSVVALSPSGLGLPTERVHQGILMATARTLTRTLRPLLGTLASTPAGRTSLLAGMRARPWEASEREALAMRGGFADSTGFWSMLWWAVLQDVPSGLHRVDSPVMLAQGAVDVVGAGQTPRYLALIPGSRFQLLPGAGHAPQSDASDAIIALVRETVERATARTTARTPARTPVRTSA